MRKATQDEGYGAAGGSMFLNGSISMELASAERRSRPHGVDEGLTVLAGSDGESDQACRDNAQENLANLRQLLQPRSQPRDRA
jgi:hypothetical protein